MTDTISLPAWANELEHRPEVFPHQLDLVNDNLLLVELSAAQVSAASFLDQRVLQQGTRGTWVSWQMIAEKFEKVEANRPPNFIFHVGHCGSTLVSRLLQQMDKTTSLREPLPLRVLAQDVADAQEGRSFLSPQEHAVRLQVLSKMWCRGAEQTVVKATSICTDLLPVIHGDDSVAKSVFVYNRAETHIATLLAGENAVVDLRGFAKLRLQRLQQKTSLKIPLHQMTVGQLAALSWLSETISATRSLETYPGQIMALEFEAFLREPGDSLRRIVDFLGIAADRGAIEKAVNSDVLQTYSKAPEHKYNAQTRSAILADSRTKFAKEIGEARAWLDDLAGRSELVAASLQKFA
tara:strand:+ start:6415 stop:7467 length:1053 start_codon:yes stop_codon:yes gene_type:complete